jgi:hypothetical protein
VKPSPFARESAGSALRTCEAVCWDLRLPRSFASNTLCSECLSLETRAALTAGSVLDLVVDES